MAGHHGQQIAREVLGFALVVGEELGVGVAIVKVYLQVLHRLGTECELQSLAVGMTGIGEHIAQSGHGVVDLLMPPVDVEQGQLGGQTVVEEVELGAHFVVPAVLGSVGALMVLLEALVKATCLIAAGDAGIVEVLLGGLILQAHLGCNLVEVHLALEVAHMALSASVEHHLLAVVVGFGVFVVVAHAGRCRESAPNVISALVIEGIGINGNIVGGGLCVACTEVVGALVVACVLHHPEHTEEPLVTTASVRLDGELLRSHALVYAIGNEVGVFV